MSSTSLRQIGAAAAVTILLPAQAVFAGPISERLSAAGQVEFGIQPETGDLSLSGDADLGLSLGWGLSLKLGLYGAATDLSGDVDTPHETYGTIGWGGNGFDLAIGVPRPGFDSAVTSWLDRFDPVRAIRPDLTGATRSRASWGAIHDGKLPVGLRLSGESSAVDWAASVHRMGDVNLAGFGVTWSPAADPDMRVGLAGEWASDGHGGAKASVDRDFGALTLGAAVFLAPAPAVEDLAELRLGWSPEPGLDLALAYQAPRHGPETALIGVEKSVGSAGFLKGSLAATDGDLSSLLGFGIRFGN